jgi:hypothetical protein
MPEQRVKNVKKPRPRRIEPGPLPRVRSICLALPGTEEKVSHERPTFRVRDKPFVMFMDNHHGDGRLAIWCKATHDAQQLLVESDPARFFVPSYVGPSGWVGIRLEGSVDWDAVTAIVAEGYQMAAPKWVTAGRAAPKRRRP